MSTNAVIAIAIIGIVTVLAIVAIADAYTETHRPAEPACLDDGLDSPTWLTWTYGSLNPKQQPEPESANAPSAHGHAEATSAPAPAASSNGDPSKPGTASEPTATEKHPGHTSDEAPEPTTP